MDGTQLLKQFRHELPWTDRLANAGGSAAELTVRAAGLLEIRGQHDDGQAWVQSEKQTICGSARWYCVQVQQHGIRQDFPGEAAAIVEADRQHREDPGVTEVDGHELAHCGIGDDHQCRSVGSARLRH
ncbi:MAG: hypothetical protein ABS84_00790 [Rubrivivax sp. SCN 71-131]|nr:MAG: hypothetical protein ABS84_00790 [Rubrivivax sp. SCN 71-131]